MNLLIVDDNHIYLELVDGWMKGSSDSYVTAKSGKEALELADKYNFDLIISDLFMPVISGVKLHDIFEEKYNIPLIIISAQPEYEMTLDNIKYKFVKPYTKDVFLNMIKSVLKKEYI